MNKQKIAIFIDWYLPSFKAGGPVKSVFSITENFKEEADFFIITSDRDFGDTTPHKNVISNEWTKVQNCKVIYLSPENQTKEKYEKLLSEITPSKVYFNSLFSKNFTLTPIGVAKKIVNPENVILAPRGMLGAGALKIKRLKKIVFLKMSKLSGLFKGIVWHASTDLESQEIKIHFGHKANIKVAENLGSQVQTILRTKKQNDSTLKILFVSRISKKKNLLFALECINLSKHKNSIQFTIVGPDEEIDYAQVCKTFCKKNNLNVDFVGGKNPLELAKLYSSHDVFILPTHHENYGHVIIESLSQGTPVIISQNTPWRNLESMKIGFDLELVQSNFAKKIDQFVEMSNEEWSEFSNNSIAFAKEKINSEKALKSNSHIFID